MAQNFWRIHKLSHTRKFENLSWYTYVGVLPKCWDLDRKLGLIFSEGNTNFDTFLTDHECNKFCKFYQLPLLRFALLSPGPGPPNLNSGHGDKGSLSPKSSPAPKTTSQPSESLEIPSDMDTSDG